MPPGPPPSGGRLDVTEEDAALVVRIANPDRANALDDAILDGLASLLNGPRAAAARCVLLAGAGERHFSAGLDLGSRSADELAAYLQQGERRIGRAASAIARCPVPVVGVLNGAVYGGALELAIACDWRIAARGIRLGMPAARIGVVYAPDGLRRFVAALGPSRARRLFLTARPVDADEALALGLVEQVVEPAELWDAARAAAADIAASAPIAVGGTRAIIRELVEPDLPTEVQRRAAEWRGRAFASGDFREGLAAFRDRRPPGFRGA
ncbi:MAG: enoyl-CoA hydratase/isomerase family protein [Thermoleophilia bacterium]